MVRLGETPCATNSALRFCDFLDQDRIVLRHRLIHRHRRCDAVLVEHIEHPEDAHAIPVLVIAVPADIGEPAATEPQAVALAHWVCGRHLPFPVLQVDDDGKSDASVVGPGENGRVLMGDHW